MIRNSVLEGLSVSRLADIQCELRDSKMKVVRYEGKEKLSVISIGMMVSRKRRDEMTERSSVKDKQDWAKDGVCGTPYGEGREVEEEPLQCTGKERDDR